MSPICERELFFFFFQVYFPLLDYQLETQILVNKTIDCHAKFHITDNIHIPSMFIFV